MTERQIFMSNVKDFLKRKDIVITPQRYLIEALGAMAQGLFASLLIGTIIKTLGQQTGLETLVDLGGYATAMSGPAMAVAIGWALHCPPLVLFSLVTVGYSSNALGGAGGPLAVLIIAIVAAELGKAVSKETRIDILVTPLVTIFSGVGLSMLIAAPIGAAASQVGTLIMWATEQAPFLMGILVSVIVGVALTLPISSAAICAALGLTGLAGGAAVAGCCAQMIGFAVMSYKENGVGGLISQGLGTSMLQMGNIVKNPRIWIAPTLASAITGPLATCVFHMEMNGAAVSSGMGTCGLVGQIGVYTGWVNDIAAGTKAAITRLDQGRRPEAELNKQKSLPTQAFFCSYHSFSVQHRLPERIPFVHQLEGEPRAFLVQQPEEDLVALPDGQLRHLLLRHPFQHALPAGIALHHLARPLIGGVEVDELGHIAPDEGQQAPAAPVGQGQACLLLHLAEKTVLRAFEPLEFAAHADPLVVVVVVLLLHPVEHQVGVVPLQIAQRRTEDRVFRVHKGSKLHCFPLLS